MHQHGSSNQSQPDHQQNRLSLPIKIVLYVSIGIIAYFLITEHQAHLAGFLPYSWLLLFVLIHLFMHGGHGGHGGSNGSNQRIAGREDELDQGHGGHGGGNDGNSQSLAKDPKLDSTNQSTSRRSNHEGHE